MDAMSAFGAMIITEGATSATTTAVLPPDAPQPPPGHVTWTAKDYDAADHHFAGHVQTPPQETSLAATLLVVTGSLSTLKGVVLDEGKDLEKKEEQRHLPETEGEDEPTP